MLERLQNCFDHLRRDWLQPLAGTRGQKPEGKNARLFAACLTHSVANRGLAPEGLGWRPRPNDL
eukprot:5930030-Lingulodinium_polyedra.AAC.1